MFLVRFISHFFLTLIEILNTIAWISIALVYLEHNLQSYYNTSFIVDIDILIILLSCELAISPKTGCPCQGITSGDDAVRLNHHSAHRDTACQLIILGISTSSL